MKSQFSFEDLIDGWDRSIKPEDLPAVIEKLGTVFDIPNGLAPGMYVYADGLIYPAILPNRQVMAVVGNVSGSEILAVCLRQKRLPWGVFYASSLLTLVGNDKEEIIHCPRCGEILIFHQEADGKKLTRCFIRHTRGFLGEKINDKSQEAGSSAWCYDYNQDGVEKYSAFLPSLTELRALFANKDAINPALKALDTEVLEGWYWTSSLYDARHAWKLKMNDGTIEAAKVWDPDYYEGNSVDINKKIYARPVLRLKRP